MSPIGLVNKRSLSITIEGDEFNAELTNARITTGASDSDTTTFAQAAAGGGRDYKFAGTALQNTSVDTIWDMIFSQSGTEVDVVYKPQGNVTASVQQPHFSFTAVVTEPDGDLLGGDADASTTAYQTIDFEWSMLDKPVKITS